MEAIEYCELERHRHQLAADHIEDVCDVRFDRIARQKRDKHIETALYFADIVELLKGGQSHEKDIH